MDKINQTARVLTACIESDHKKPDSQYDVITAQFNFSTHFRKHGTVQQIIPTYACTIKRKKNYKISQLKLRYFSKIGRFDR